MITEVSDDTSSSSSSSISILPQSQISSLKTQKDAVRLYAVAMYGMIRLSTSGVRSVRARSARILITSLKYYEYHCITDSYHYTLKNYDLYYSLMLSNVTKHLTRASRSNTGTRNHECVDEISSERRGTTLGHADAASTSYNDCDAYVCSSAKRENFNHISFSSFNYVTQITRISL